MQFLLHFQGQTFKPKLKMDFKICSVQKQKPGILLQCQGQNHYERCYILANEEAEYHLLTSTPLMYTWNGINASHAGASLYPHHLLIHRFNRPDSLTPFSTDWWGFTLVSHSLILIFHIPQHFVTWAWIGNTSPRTHARKMVTYWPGQNQETHRET